MKFNTIPDNNYKFTHTEWPTLPSLYLRNASPGSMKVLWLEVQKGLKKKKKTVQCTKIYFHNFFVTELGATSCAKKKKKNQRRAC